MLTKVTKSSAFTPTHWFLATFTHNFADFDQTFGIFTIKKICKTEMKCEISVWMVSKKSLKIFGWRFVYFLRRRGWGREWAKEIIPYLS